MSTEGTISWEILKNLADALDSYRIRALIDAKLDVLKAGIYDEVQYDNLLLNMLDEEKLKFSLYEYLRKNTDIPLKIRGSSPLNSWNANIKGIGVLAIVIIRNCFDLNKSLCFIGKDERIPPKFSSEVNNPFLKRIGRKPT